MAIKISEMTPAIQAFASDLTEVTQGFPGTPVTRHVSETQRYTLTKEFLAAETEGVVISPITQAQRDAIVSPAEGLEIWNLTTNKKNFYNGTDWVEADDLPVFTQYAIPVGKADGTLGEFPATFSFNSAFDQLSVGAPNTTITINGELRNGSFKAVSNGVPEKWGLIGEAFGTTTSSVITLTRARGSVAAPQVSQSGDELGCLCFAGYDGTDYGYSASIRSIASATHANNSTPASLVFYTTAAGASTGTEALRLSSTQNLSTPKSVSINTTNSSFNISGFGTLPVGLYVEESASTAAIEVLLTSYGPFRHAGVHYFHANGTSAAPTAAASGDAIMIDQHIGYDGSANLVGAEYRTIIDGAVSAGVVPTRFEWGTRNTSGTFGTRMTLTSSGNLGIGDAAQFDRLHVSDTVENTRIRIHNTGTAGNRNAGVLHLNSELNYFTGVSGVGAAAQYIIYSNTSAEPRIVVHEATDNVGISDNGGTFTPNASAALEINSTTRGFLPPQMTTTQRNAISSPAAGLMIFNTTTSQWEGYNGTSWVVMG